MLRKTLWSWMVICALVGASCSGTPQTPTTPSGAAATVTFLNPDGSSVKVTAPVAVSPSGPITTRTPTLTFNPSTGVYVPVTLTYDIVIRDSNNQIVHEANVAGSPYDPPIVLTYADNYTWNVRPRLGTQFGPLSNTLQFRTPDPPTTTTTTIPASVGGLPFPIPAQCNNVPPGGGFACAAAIAGQSVEWAGCAGGSGTRCHRFTRQVAYALSRTDPNWRLIQAAPGGQACNCSFCGPSDGSMFREDTVVYGGNRVFDMIVGAGGPAPSLTWSEVPGPRPGDIPNEAPICVP